MVRVVFLLLDDDDDGLVKELAEEEDDTGGRVLRTGLGRRLGLTNLDDDEDDAAVVVAGLLVVVVLTLPLVVVVFSVVDDSVCCSFSASISESMDADPKLSDGCAVVDVDDFLVGLISRLRTLLPTLADADSGSLRLRGRRTFESPSTSLTTTSANKSRKAARRHILKPPPTFLSTIFLVTGITFFNAINWRLMDSNAVDDGGH